MLADWTMVAPDPAFAGNVQRAIDRKTKPPGSLGRIEALALQIACVQGTERPVVDPAHLLLFAGDHGLVAEGVSAWPQDVTAQMVMNFITGGAAANAFARIGDCAITVVDAGVAGALPDAPGLVRANIRKGTRNAAVEDALTSGEVDQALTFGAQLAAKTADAGARVIALGEMGIGNTSSAALLGAVLTGHDVADLAGPGAGLDADGVESKRSILRRTAARHPARLAPLPALAAFGGLEIACMAGALIGAASKGTLVVVDGFIATAAALCALTARPDAMGHVVFAHRSKEPGHDALLTALGAQPLLDLGLRLGEGTGALLALPLLRASCSMLSDMATFESAGVSGKD